MFKRRAFFGSLSAAAVLAASGLPLQAAPRRGGRLRAGLGGAHPSETWDSRTHRGGTFMTVAAQGAVFDTLTQIAADGSLQGDLATDWQASTDARRWVVTLRRDVAFHDGTLFGAADVLASLGLHWRTGSPAAPLLADLADMRATGPYEVTFDLASGHADFPWLLSDSRLLIYPAQDMARAMAQGIGTGLYRVQAFQPGRRLRATRVAAHWKDGQAGWFDDLDLIALPDATARRDALLRGQVDVVDGLDPRDVPALQGQAGHRVLSVQGNAALGLQLPDPALAAALRPALDRAALVRDALAGQGRVGQDTPIGPGHAHAEVAPPVAFDPDLARALLRAAGHAGATLDLHASCADHPAARALARQVAADAARAGLRIEVVTAQGHPARAGRACATLLSPGRATEDWTLLCDGLPDDPNLHALARAARAALDGARRRAIYAELLPQLRDRSRRLLPVFVPQIAGLSTRLAMEDPVGPHAPLDNGRMAERWWLT